jgi:hypothetical protein
LIEARHYEIATVAFLWLRKRLKSVQPVAVLGLAKDAQAHT